MPLKLLSKKSWHVYNADNIARVRRDEAEATARRDAEERLDRAAESARQSALLRGEAAPDEDDGFAARVATEATGATRADADLMTTEPVAARRDVRRPRKRHGEDDTDFEMRLARAHIEGAEGNEDGAGRYRDRHNHHDRHDRRHSERPLVDSRGHFDLLGVGDRGRATVEEDGGDGQGSPLTGAAPLTTSDIPTTSMRFADAAGSHGLTATAWYAATTNTANGDGDGDGRRATAVRRTHTPSRPPLPPPAGSLAADPLAAMKQGAAAVRALHRERQREAAERRSDLDAMIAEQSRQAPASWWGDQDEESERGDMKETVQTPYKTARASRHGRDDREQRRHNRHGHSRRRCNDRDQDADDDKDDNDDHYRHHHRDREGRHHHGDGQDRSRHRHRSRDRDRDRDRDKDRNRDRIRDRSTRHAARDGDGSRNKPLYDHHSRHRHRHHQQERRRSQSPRLSRSRSRSRPRTTQLEQQDGTHA